LKEDIIQNLITVMNNKFALQCRDVPQLYEIYDTLIGDYARFRLLIDDINFFHKHVYSFFAIVCKINQSSKYFQHYRTKIFEDFIRGITVFKSDDESVPYHPSKDVRYASKFRITHTDDKIAREAKIKTLRKCIIERKIHDDIFKYTLKQQDPLHFTVLLNLERLYMEYTSYKIDVSVHYRNDVTPCMVMIRTYRNDNLVMVETYEKGSNGSVIVERCKTRQHHSDKQYNIQGSTRV
jgi:hypothetical protein